MRSLLLSLMIVGLTCAGAWGDLTTPAMQFEAEGAWLSAAPELFTEFKPEEIWAVRLLPLPELGAGVKLRAEHVKQGKTSGRWADHPHFPTIHTTNIPHDWSGQKALSFWAWSEVLAAGSRSYGEGGSRSFDQPTGELVTVAALSDNPATAWKDYFVCTFAADWTGWRKLTMALADFEKLGEPAGWGQVEALYFFTKIFERQPNPYTVLELDDMRLVSEAVASDLPRPRASGTDAPTRQPGTLSIKGQVAPLDYGILNHSYPEVRDQVTTPFQVMPYFQAERALYGYYPRYHPGFVSFDPSGRPYLQYGAGMIETLAADGKWQVRDLLTEVVEPYAREVMGYKELDLGDGGQGNETAIRWDRDGGMYLLVNIAQKNSEWETRKALLLYSPDGMKTWQVYVLPEYMARFEKFVGHNPDCLNRPPVILLSRYLSPTRISLLLPEKQADGTLRLPEPVLLAEDGVALIPHSGESNQAVSHGDEVIVVYGRLTVLPGHKKEDGVPSFARVYNRQTGQLGEPVLIGFGGINSEDDHNWPGIAPDSRGILQVIINGHHDPFVYTHSARPWDISGWTECEKVASGTSYAGLVCDDQDTLYSVTRHAEPGYYFRLSLHRKQAGQPWEDPKYLVIPYKPYYHVYYHKLTLDPRRQRLFLCYWSQTLALCLFRDEFWAAIYMWPHREMSFRQENANLPLGSCYKEPAKYEFYTAPSSELTILMSEDRGETWRLAATGDFEM